MGIFEADPAHHITAATPLLIAGIGELVVERSGVLNLGVEGMMIMGAVTGFGVPRSRPARRGSAFLPPSSSARCFPCCSPC
jgi:ABC-type uncharacterized transport system permease subunit